MDSRIAVGIDLGGTIVRVGAFNTQGNLLFMHESLTEAPRGPEFGLRKIQGMIEQILAESEAKSLIGIGIGASGPVDRLKGIINNPFTLPTWENVQVIDSMQKVFDVPITLENDADVAALGEYWRGAGQSTKRLYAVTIGTGIGTSLIVNGEIYRGLEGSHPEGGHMILDPSGPLCYCKMHGCWESLCAGPAIGVMARESDLKNSHMLEMANGDQEMIDGRIVFDAARNGDLVAITIVNKVSQYFTQGILNVAILFVPDVIVLSGGVMRSIDLLMPRIEQTLHVYNEMIPAHRIKIVPAQLGYYAGLYGAAYTILSGAL